MSVVWQLSSNDQIEKRNAPSLKALFSNPLTTNNPPSHVELQREELKDLHDAVGCAITVFEREPAILSELIEQCDGIDDPDEIMNIIQCFEFPTRLEEETVEDLKRSLKMSKKLLPKVHDLADFLVKCRSTIAT
jgi:hypothetical protein